MHGAEAQSSEIFTASKWRERDFNMKVFQWLGRHSGARIARTRKLCASPFPDSGFEALPRPGTTWNIETIPATAGSERADPIAVKAIRHPVSELHQRHRPGRDIAGSEDREIAAIFTGTPDRRQQPAVALGGILAAGDEYRLGDGVAGRQEIFAEPPAPAVDMHDAGQRADHRQVRIGAGVPAVAADKTGALSGIVHVDG